MFCSKCGVQNNDGIKFCADCGNGLNQSTATPSAPNSPGQELLIAAGVLLLIFGAISSVGLWGIMQVMGDGYLARIGRMALEATIGMPFAYIFIMGLTSTAFMLGCGIESLVYCKNPAKANMLLTQGIAILVLALIDTFMTAPKTGFSILHILIPGTIVLFIAGAYKNRTPTAVTAHTIYLNQRSAGKNTNRATVDATQSGKLLASGFGIDSHAIAFWWFICFVLGTVGLFTGVIFAYVLQEPEYTTLYGLRIETGNQVFGTASMVFLGFGFALIGTGLIDAVIIHTCIAKTRIDVFEDRVQGNAVDTNFFIGKYRCKDFYLEYDQITSIDVSSVAIVIHASNAQYKCYVKNGTKIRNIMLERKKLLKL
jgi:hypothetical protein